VSQNLAKSYAALGKKVLLVGADLRNPQLHKFLGRQRENIGLSSYLSDESFNDLDALITKADTPGGLDYLLTGAIPPNPSELLMRPRMKELLDILKQRYDFVIIDSAPLLLVSDTTAVLPLCDLVVYVTRSQFSEKKTFPFILDMQKRPNVPPFGMVLNGLVAGPNSGSNYGYKYRYSYGYSYNYGYGYGYGSDTKN
jgi:tyrosine-protein kinase Etk/Wzc